MKAIATGKIDVELAKLCFIKSLDDMYEVVEHNPQNLEKKRIEEIEQRITEFESVQEKINKSIALTEEDYKLVTVCYSYVTVLMSRQEDMAKEIKRRLEIERNTIFAYLSYKEKIK